MQCGRLELLGWEDPRGNHQGLAWRIPWIEEFPAVADVCYPWGHRVDTPNDSHHKAKLKDILRFRVGSPTVSSTPSLFFPPFQTYREKIDDKFLICEV